MKQMPLTLIQLQVALGNVILATLDESKNDAERAAAMATASSVYGGASRLIHNASTIMRAKELIADGKVKDIDSIKAIVGDV